MAALSEFERILERAPAKWVRVGGEIVDAGTGSIEDGVVAFGVVIPDEVSTGIVATQGNARKVPGGVLFAVDVEDLAEQILDSLDALEAAGPVLSETFRRRLAVLRRLAPPGAWVTAVAVRDEARRLAGDG